MDPTQRRGAGKILQNRIGQLFFVCETCFCEFLSIESFTQHQTIAHGAEPDPTAQMTFTEETRCIVITKAFNAIPSFADIPTKQISQSAPTSPSTTNHRNSGHAEAILGKKFTCEECSTTFISLAGWRAHEASCRRQKTQFNCDYCVKIFASITTLSLHVERHHQESLPTNDEAILIEKFKCEGCSKTFISWDDLIVHEASCRRPKTQLKCDYCAKTYTSVTGLRLHVHRHHKSNLPSFVCTVCPMAFNQRFELTLHKRKHALKNTQVECDFCDKLFLSKYEKYGHVQLEHPFAVHQCKDCRFECKYKRVLKRHRMIAHN